MQNIAQTLIDTAELLKRLDRAGLNIASERVDDDNEKLLALIRAVQEHGARESTVAALGLLDE